MKLAEIAITPPVAAISVMLLALTGAASTGVLRVADKGTGDGSSWDAPIGIISNALARADELVKSGAYDHVEVWIKEGRYRTFDANVNENYALLPSEVTVCGGFAGTETIADQADPIAHPTVITGDRGADNWWYPNGKEPGRSHIFKSADSSQESVTAFREPNPDGTDEYWTINRGPAGNDYQNGFRYLGAVSNSVIRGLSFVSGFTTSAIGPKDDTCTLYNCTVSNCQFVGIMGTGAIFRGRDNLVTHCSFRNNGASLQFEAPTNRVASGWLPKSALVRDCEFVEHNGSSPCVNTHDAVDGSLFILSNCVFRSNCNRSESNPPLLISAGGSLKVTNVVCDCQFVSNRVYSGGRGLIGSNSPSYQNGSRIEIARTEFVGNRCTNATYSSAICFFDRGYGRNWVVTDCLFAHNVDTSIADGVTRASVSAVFAASTTLYFQNCTFLSNVVSLAEGSADAATFYHGNATGHQLGLVHCVLKDNVLVAGASGQAAEAMFLKPGNVCDFSFVNTIFYNTADGYRPFALGVNGTYKVNFTDVCCYHPAGIDESCVTGLVNFRRWAYPVTETPAFTDLKKGSNGVRAVGVYANPGSVGKDAIPAFVNDDGEVRFYDPKFGGADKPFFRLHYFVGDGRLSPEAAKCTTASPLLADAFGQARQFKRSALGPLNAPKTGLMLLLR